MAKGLHPRNYSKKCSSAAGGGMNITIGPFGGKNMPVKGRRKSNTCSQYLSGHRG